MDELDKDLLESQHSVEKKVFLSGKVRIVGDQERCYGQPKETKRGDIR